MPLSRLATVELQLIMQHCDRRSLLSLARCSRFTLASAASDFVWRPLSPVTLSSRLPVAPDLGSRLSRPGCLLRHADIRLRWDVGRLDSRFGEVREEELWDIKSVPRVVSLDASSRGNIRMGAWEKLLAHPGLSGLTELRLSEWSCMVDCPLRLPSLASSWPRLRSIALHIGQSHSDAQDWPSLPLLPSLARLRVQVSGRSDDDATVRSLAACEHLRFLDISGKASAVWQSLLASPHLCSLHELRVHSIQGELVVAWARCFSLMVGLQRLRIGSYVDAEEVVRALTTADPHSESGVRCPALELLSVSPLLTDDEAAVQEQATEEAQQENGGAGANATAQHLPQHFQPSVRLLHSLLRDRPSLHLQLRLVFDAADGVCDLTRAHESHTRHTYAPLLHEFTRRVEFAISVPDD